MSINIKERKNYKEYTLLVGYGPKEGTRKKRIVQFLYIMLTDINIPSIYVCLSRQYVSFNRWLAGRRLSCVTVQQVKESQSVIMYFIVFILFEFRVYLLIF